MAFRPGLKKILDNYRGEISSSTSTYDLALLLAGTKGAPHPFPLPHSGKSNNKSYKNIYRDCSEKTYKSLKSMEKHSNF
jgi:hypothetical protein